jgi:hypothetical protein
MGYCYFSSPQKMVIMGCISVMDGQWAGLGRVQWLGDGWAGLRPSPPPHFVAYSLCI